VIFGASGDLTARKLIPALYHLAVERALPTPYRIIGFARREKTPDSFRSELLEALRKYSRTRTVDESVWNDFAKNIEYCQADISEAAGYGRLKQMIQSASDEKLRSNLLFYLATNPSQFGEIAEHLSQVGLLTKCEDGGCLQRLVVEKPLNEVLRKSLAEEQIYRIDHYLGKETVQNILVFRFANGIFEPLWNRKYIDHIQISVCEDIGIGSRAAYFDENGIVRDIVQNHVLQMLSLLCIEPPISLSDANSIRDEKAKVLRSIKRMTPDEVKTNTVRAQYGTGVIGGQPVVSYLEEKGVKPSSTTDTYVALKLEIDNWRWSGVPIYIRAGKRLQKRITEIKVFFNKAPDSLFKGRQVGELEHNVLSIQVQPKEGMSLRISSKQPGPRFRVRPVEMDFTYDNSFGVASPEAYERLLLDVMKGDPTLFTRNDEIEESWDLRAPIFETWSSAEAPPVLQYAAGTWGPPEADDLLRPMGHSWRKL